MGAIAEDSRNSGRSDHVSNTCLKVRTSNLTKGKTMWFAIIMLTLVNSVGWFLFGISIGETKLKEMEDKLPEIKPYKFAEPRQLDV